MSTSFTLTRRGLLLSASALGFVAALPSLSFAVEPVRGGTLTFNIGSESPVLVSLTNTGSAIYTGPKIVEGLLTYDFDFNPQPQLATEWRVSEDGRRYWFRLREGVKWHDGADFTAEDVAFSILTLKQVHPRGRATFANVTEANVLGPLEVELVLSNPAPFLLTALAALESPIIPKHLYEGTDIVSNPQLFGPVGTGPFIFKEWVRGSHVTVERNPNYWDPGKPYLDRIVFRFIGDPSSAVAALEAGEVLLAAGTGSGTVPLHELSRILDNKQFGLETRGYGYINSIVRGLFNLDNPILAKQQVRLAIAHAIDRNLIAETAYLGRAKVLDGPVTPDLPAFHAPDLPQHAYDPALAESLLDQAGYPRGANGFRFALTIDPMMTAGPQRQAVDYIAQALKRVGIDATIRTQDFAAFVGRVYTQRDFDFAIESMSNLFDPSVGVQRLYWSKNFKPGVPFSNGAHYANPEVDRLLEAAAIEVDPARRFQFFAEFQRIIAEELPALDIVAPQSFTVFNVRVQNHTLGSEGLSNNGAQIFLLPA